MAFSIQKGDQECTLAVWGGLVSESNPSDLPSGVSPDCGEMVFVPGSTSSRPGLKKVFASPFGAVTVTYAKSYVDPVGVIRNLYLDSAGNMWVGIAGSGTYTLLTTTTTGSYAKSITAFGREYIAISDGLNGSDIPLQYDGTNLDRVTQDGPGASPNVASFAIPSVAMAVTPAPGALTVLQIDPTGISGSGGYYTAANISVVAGASALTPGTIVTVSGTTGTFDLTYTVTATYADTVIAVAAYFPPGTGSYSGGGSVGITSGTTITRAGNIVTVKTAAAHQLQPGYQAQIAGVTAAVVGSTITTVVINNEDLPSLATVTTSTAHGLIPGLYVSMVGIAGTSVGGGITSIVRNGQVVTVTTATANGLNPRGVITISGVTTASFNSTAIVQNIVSTTVFTFIQVDVDAADSTGTVTLNWTVPDTPTPSYFQVQSAPTPTSFQVSVNYPDGSWTGGTVTYAWNGTFFVQSVPSTTLFTYQQYGPDATSTVVGTVTPYGQASPGKKQMQVAFLTRQGYITRPSPPATVTSNGGEYYSVTNIPIGPTNVVARILLFTGANGAYFFYIPTTPQVNGQIVGTATQINDNTTTSVVLDFSDNTLFAAIGVSVQGNNIANQIILDGALGFGFFGSRLLTYGQRNRIQNLLNLGFDGGYLPSSTTAPTGWTVAAGGALAAGHYGSGWLITTVAAAGAKGRLSQPMYQDYSGAPIATANTFYKFRAWLRSSTTTINLSFFATITSASTGFSSTAAISGSIISTAGGWLESPFNAKMPASIPTDLTLSLYASSVTSAYTLLIDDMSIIYSDAPYLNQIIYGSYVDNPEAFDGVSGKFGPSQDTHKIMDFGTIRNNLYLLTCDPSGRIHEAVDNGVTEPAGWTVDEVGANCGLLSAFGLTRSQADDSSASGGEEWMAWASSSGARIFGGGEPWKISQEIQPNWTGDAARGIDGINTEATRTVWAMNDSVARVIYFGLPIGAAATAPNKIFIVDYKNLDSASQIAGADPVRALLSGKMEASDNARKWCPWNRATNGAALMYNDSVALKLEPIFFTGNGRFPGALAGGYGNVYTLDPTKLTDDNYGLISPYYVTFFFPDPELLEKLGAHRKMLAYLTGQISGVGTVTITPYVNNLSNNWPLVCARTLAADPDYDLEWAGGNVVGQRIAFKIASAPVSPATNNSLTIQGLVPVIRTSARIPVRGKA